MTVQPARLFVAAIRQWPRLLVFGMNSLMRRTKDDDGLTVQQTRFCRLIAQGRTGHDAFLEAFPKSRAKGESVDTMASRLMNRIEIKSRIRELLRVSRAADMDSQGEVYKDLCSAITKAEAAGNWTAYSSLMRLRMSHMGMLQDHMGSDSFVSDEKLLTDLAAGDPEKLQLLRVFLVPLSFATGPKDNPDAAGKIN
jgi:hypothetical protein